MNTTKDDMADELLTALERLSAQCDRLRLPGQAMTDAEKNAREVIAKSTGQHLQADDTEKGE